MTTKWEVPREWVGETVAILASGPSMSRETAEYVRGKCRVIAINNQGIPTDVDGVRQPAMAPWADVLYAADAKWWVHYADRALKFEGLKVTIRHMTTYPEVLHLEQSTSQPFDDRPTHLVTGGNSGYQAIHLAAHFGATRILLCGYDMRQISNRKHWFGDHPGKLNSPQRYDNWIANFARLAPALKERGVEVLNCTAGSALKCFTRARLEEVI